LKQSRDYAALLTFDNFKAQYMPTILTLLDQSNINVVLVPASCTDRLQLLGLSVNKPVKSFLRTKFQTKEVYSQLQHNKSKSVDLRFSHWGPSG